MSEDKIPDDRDAGEEPMVAKEYHGSVAWGVGQILLFHLLQIPLVFLTFYLSLALISLSQLAYVIPAIIVARRRGHEETLKGIIIASSVTALLNVACTGYMVYYFKLL